MLTKTLFIISSALLMSLSLGACSARPEPHEQLEKLISEKGDNFTGISVSIGGEGKANTPSVIVSIPEGNKVTDYELVENKPRASRDEPLNKFDNPIPANSFNLEELIQKANTLHSDKDCFHASFRAISTTLGIGVLPSCQSIEGTDFPRDELATWNGEPAFTQATARDDVAGLVNAGAEIAKITKTTEADELTFMVQMRQILVSSPAAPGGLPCSTGNFISEDHATNTVWTGCPAEESEAENPTFALNEPTLSAIVEQNKIIENFPLQGIDMIQWTATTDSLSWTVSSANLAEQFAHPEYSKGSIPRP